MALKPPPPPWEVLKHVNDLMGDSGLKGDLDKSARSLAQSALSRLDMVSREEFDAQSDILLRTRAQVTELESQLAELTATLEALSSTG